MPRRAADARPRLRHLVRPAVARRAATTNSLGAVPGESTAHAARGLDDTTADAPRRRGPRRVGILGLAVAAVVLALCGAVWLIADRTSSGAPAASPQSAYPGGQSSSAGSSAGSSADSSQQTAPPTLAATTFKAGSKPQRAIEVTTPLETAEPFETARIRGSFPGGGDTFLEVQRRTDGTWQSFPVPAKTDSSGQFTAYVELGQPGRYQMRVIDPRSRIASQPFTLVIKG